MSVVQVGAAEAGAPCAKCRGLARLVLPAFVSATPALIRSVARSRYAYSPVSGSYAEALAVTVAGPATTWSAARPWKTAPRTCTVALQSAVPLHGTNAESSR